MSRAEVLAVVRTVAQQLLDVDPVEVQESTSFVDDLAVDSLALVEYAMALEDALHVQITDDDLAATTTVGQLLDLLVGRVPAVPGAGRPSGT